jgi:GntR family transcriptional repressor for pyruvate dehydrogenase complex
MSVKLEFMAKVGTERAREETPAEVTRRASGRTGVNGPDRARPGNVTQRAMVSIQEMIRSGELAPGQAIPSQRVLASQLGVSRAALREALSILDTLGMVRIEPARGMFVTDDAATPASAAAPIHSWRFASRYAPQEVYQFRYIAEPQASFLAAMHRTDDEVAALRRNLELFREATRTMDLVQSAQLDFDFHRLIMEMSRNRMLVDLHRTYHQVLQESQRLPFAAHHRVWEPAIEHERIVQAIAMHDPQGSAYYMRVHINRAAERVDVAITDLV